MCVCMHKTVWGQGRLFIKKVCEHTFVCICVCFYQCILSDTLRKNRESQDVEELVSNTLKDNRFDCSFKC